MNYNIQINKSKIKDVLGTHYMLRRLALYHKLSLTSLLLPAFTVFFNEQGS